MMSAVWFVASAGCLIAFAASLYTGAPMVEVALWTIASLIALQGLDTGEAS